MRLLIAISILLVAFGSWAACDGQEPVAATTPAAEQASSEGHFLPGDIGSPDELFSMEGVSFEAMRPVLEKLHEADFITEEQLAEIMANPGAFMEVVEALMTDPESFGIDVEAELAWRDSVMENLIEGISVEAAMEAADQEEELRR